MSLRRPCHNLADVAEISNILQLANIGGHFANQRIALASLRGHCLKPPFRSPDTAAERRAPDVAEISNILQLANIGGHFANQRIAIASLRGLCLKPPFRSPDTAAERRAPDVAEISNIVQLNNIGAMLRTSGLRLRRCGDTASNRRVTARTLPQSFSGIARTLPQNDAPAWGLCHNATTKHAPCKPLARGVTGALPFCNSLKREIRLN